MTYNRRVSFYVPSPGGLDKVVVTYQHTRGLYVDGTAYWDSSDMTVCVTDGTFLTPGGQQMRLVDNGDGTAYLEAVQPVTIGHCQVEAI